MSRIPAQTGLRASHHRAADARLLGQQFDRADPHGLPAPAVLRPALTGFIDEDVRTEPADVPVTVRVSRRASARLAVVNTNSAIASTNLPGGIVHSIAALVSSVASAKNSARSPCSRFAGTRRTGRASQSLKAASVMTTPSSQSHREERSPVRWPR